MTVAFLHTIQEAKDTFYVKTPLPHGYETLESELKTRQYNTEVREDIQWNIQLRREIEICKLNKQMNNLRKTVGKVEEVTWVSIREERKR